MNYWNFIEDMIDKNGFVIDRKKGTAHPRYAHMIYPIDYGYIENTQSTDNNEIDIFVGSKNGKGVVGVINTIDKMKNDIEAKIVFNCSYREIKMILSFLNNSDYMKAIFIRRT
jgi:inorganic pyrophosphatase